MTAFQKFLTATASTTRRGVAKVTSFPIMEICPASPDVLLRVTVESPFTAFETYCDVGRDITQGDVLTTGGVSYTVRGVESWDWTNGTQFMYLVLERMKV